MCTKIDEWRDTTLVLCFAIFLFLVHQPSQDFLHIGRALASTKIKVSSIYTSLPHCISCFLCIAPHCFLLSLSLFLRKWEKTGSYQMLCSDTKTLTNILVKNTHILLFLFLWITLKSGACWCSWMADSFKKNLLLLNSFNRDEKNYLSIRFMYF
jgi:hypothetical protein